jgi:hypothetical protein
MSAWHENMRGGDGHPHSVSMVRATRRLAARALGLLVVPPDWTELYMQW